MAIKKPELYGSLWKSRHKLRGGLDASQHEDCVLILLIPAQVSHLTAEVIDIGQARSQPLTIYLQKMDKATAALARKQTPRMLPSQFFDFDSLCLPVSQGKPLWRDPNTLEASLVSPVPRLGALPADPARQHLPAPGCVVQRS